MQQRFAKRTTYCRRARCGRQAWRRGRGRDATFPARTSARNQWDPSQARIATAYTSIGVRPLSLSRTTKHTKKTEGWLVSASSTRGKTAYDEKKLSNCLAEWQTDPVPSSQRTSTGQTCGVRHDQRMPPARRLKSGIERWIHREDRGSSGNLHHFFVCFVVVIGLTAE